MYILHIKKLNDYMAFVWRLKSYKQTLQIPRGKYYDKE